MPSLTEALGGLASYVFVPSNVAKAQDENQRMLTARAEALNGNAPSILARATQTGMLTNEQAKLSLQDMNRSIFLVDDSQRQLGEQVVSDVKDSAANAPKVLLEYTGEKILAPAAGVISGTVKALVPWQIWLIVGIALAIGVGVFSFVKAKT